MKKIRITRFRMSRWVILYTPDKHKHKKWQKWHDGFLQIAKCGRSATIFDEENELVGKFFLRQKDRIFDGAGWGLSTFSQSYADHYI